MSEAGKIYFVGAGPGATDLITLRGQNLLERADVVVYAGSLVNPKLLEYTKKDCVIHDSAGMTLEEVVRVLRDAAARGLLAVRLHTGDPSLYGAIREQMDIMREKGLEFEAVPGVSSFFAAAAALDAEYTLPGVAQSLIITRAAGRTPVPEKESLGSLAIHKTSMVLFLSSGMIQRVCEELIEGGYSPNTPAAVVYKASWPEQLVIRGDLSDIAGRAERAGIDKTALILVGDFLGQAYERSRLYDPSFSHGFRNATEEAAQKPHCEPSENACSGRPAHVYAAFSADGVKTALAIREKLGGVVYAPGRFVRSESESLRRMQGTLDEWAREHFRAKGADRARSLVFVCSAGIAVRAVAPHLEGKTTDPAVICLDDLGRNVVPLLSGHIGGANGLAVQIAEITGGRPIITTSTDIRGIKAADSWAAEKGLAIENPEAVKDVSAAMIEGRQVGIAITEDLSAGADLPWPVTLLLRPKNLILGIGCKRGIGLGALEEAASDFLEGAGVSELSIAAAASVDLKADEPAILAWAKRHGVPALFYPASELDSLCGKFSSSEWVRETTGTDNVCERAAIMAAGRLSPECRAVLMRSKTVYPGITLALAKIAKTGKRGSSDGSKR